MTVGSAWEVERLCHQGPCEPCWGGGLDHAVVGGQGEVGSRDGLCEDRAEGTMRMMRYAVDIFPCGQNLGPFRS